ncbi:MAG: glycosyltransferase family 4 protein [Chloroflexi bacterium]|nr:MAG: glycosyltransferase family 4 protein [Chloroflexota bacterium]
MTFPADSTIFAVLSFEGPDVYSQAGGLGVRAKELSRALASAGYETHLFFLGDPDLPAEEEALDGRLRLHRWGQWLSRSHRGGVYDGEDVKVVDWNRSLPSYLVDHLVEPAARAGKLMVVLGEEWHTADSMRLIAEALFYRGLRDRAVILWNANNTFGFHRINWRELEASATLTTVSRYMKHRMWEVGVNPIVIPNGIPAAALVDAPAADVSALRAAAGADLLLFKIGRFDPDKRWIMAMTAAGLLKRQGLRVRVLMRGGREPHGADVLAHAATHGLVVEDSRSPQDQASLLRLFKTHAGADVVNLVSFLPEGLLGTLYAASDAVLANSGHEPFGLVGLEVMAAGGLAVTGSTGEDYAEPFRNAVVLETEDPLELVGALRQVRSQPAWAAHLRANGRATAREFTWDHVLDQLRYWLDLAALRQGVERLS